MNKPVDMLKMVTAARKNLQPSLDIASLLAEIRWHSYHEHIKAGFTPEQALTLCKVPLNFSGD